MSNDIGRVTDRLVHKLKSDGWMRSSAVEDAFLRVQRHLFLDRLSPEENGPSYDFRSPSQDQLEKIYDPSSCIVFRMDPTAPDGGISCISAPDVIAEMLESLELAPGLRVLEIGTGSGYNAALLAHTVGDHRGVYTIESLPDVARSAKDHLARAGFKAVTVICGDGGDGYQSAAPYDRIIATASCKDIAPAWANQLGEDGVLLMPWRLTSGPQALLKMRRAGQFLIGRTEHPAGFIGLQGSHGEPESTDVVIASSDASLRALIAQPLSNRPLPERLVRTGTRHENETAYGLLFFLCLELPSLRRIIAREAARPSGIDGSLPWLGLFDRDLNSLALIFQPGLEVGSYGTEAMAQRILAATDMWESAGRPGLMDYRVRVPAQGHPPSRRPGRKQWRLQLRWHTWDVWIEPKDSVR